MDVTGLLSMNYTWFCFSGDFLFLALLFGTFCFFFFVFSRVLQPIQVYILFRLLLDWRFFEDS